MYVLKQSLVPEQEYFFGRIQTPTLIVHGVKDTMVKVKRAITLSKKIVGSETVLIPNTDHIVVLNNTKEVSEAMVSFLEKNIKNLL